MDLLSLVYIKGGGGGWQKIALGWPPKAEPALGQVATFANVTTVT